MDTVKRNNNNLTFSVVKFVLVSYRVFGLISFNNCSFIELSLTTPLFPWFMTKGGVQSQDMSLGSEYVIRGVSIKGVVSVKQL